jgi:GNAT superfamily N-acetyltransferase
VKLARTTSRDPDFIALRDRLDAELRERYGDLQDLYAPHNVFVCETVIVGYLDGVPVACGCFKAYDGAAELKRMYVAPQRRGARLGREIVAALEAWAGELGFREMVLETGNLQPEAVTLYERCGYERTASYGVYVDMPTSICMRKPITAADASR